MAFHSFCSQSLTVSYFKTENILLHWHQSPYLLKRNKTFQILPEYHRPFLSLPSPNTSLLKLEHILSMYSFLLLSYIQNYKNNINRIKKKKNAINVMSCHWVSKAKRKIKTWGGGQAPTMASGGKPWGRIRFTKLHKLHLCTSFSDVFSSLLFFEISRVETHLCNPCKWAHVLRLHFRTVLLLFKKRLQIVLLWILLIMVLGQSFWWHLGLDNSLLWGCLSVVRCLATSFDSTH